MCRSLTYSFVTAFVAPLLSRHAIYTNVREFQDYSSLASLVFRNECLVDHLHGHLHADCDLLYWLPWNSNNGILGRGLLCRLNLIFSEPQRVLGEPKPAMKRLSILF